tara:strand:+ start:35 stop:331 length:297 start_codon:yes stop_codon:yes gene_type:complete
MFGKGNMNKMMKKMMQLQQEIESMEVEGNAGGGAVKVKLNGKKEILSLNISDELLKDDKEMLEDMIIACINQAQEEVDRISKEKMGALSGGMPGLPGF